MSPKKGREDIKPYVMICYDQLNSAAWTALDFPASWLFIETLKSFNPKKGGNSGLRLPYSQVEWKMAPGTYCKYMKQLVEYGHLDIVKKGGVKLRQLTIYRRSDRWKEISLKIVDKEGREAIKQGLAPKPGSKNVSKNLDGHRPWEPKKRALRKKTLQKLQQKILET